MAEAIARHLIDEGLLGDDPDVFVASAGVAAANGAPPTAEAVAALGALGIEHHGKSKLLTADMVANADLIYSMTSGHVQIARELVEGQDNDKKIMRLDPDDNIGDPHGLDQSAYDALAGRLMKIIPQRLREHARA